MQGLKSVTEMSGPLRDSGGETSRSTAMGNTSNDLPEDQFDPFLASFEATVEEQSLQQLMEVNRECEYLFIYWDLCLKCSMEEKIMLLNSMLFNLAMYEDKHYVCNYCFNSWQAFPVLSRCCCSGSG